MIVVYFIVAEENVKKYISGMPGSDQNQSKNVRIRLLCTLVHYRHIEVHNCKLYAVKTKINRWFQRTTLCTDFST